jgi:hypothetical protein
VPIEFTDEEIDHLQPLLWEKPQKIKINVPREKLIEYIRSDEDEFSLSVDELSENPKIEFMLKSTLEVSGYDIIRVQDRMIVHILTANKFQRPVYFSVTVSPQNLMDLDNRSDSKTQKNYLRLDGLAFKVIPYGGDRNFISPINLESNLFKNFHYKTISYEHTKYNNTISGLWKNYRAVFLRLIKLTTIEIKG